MEGSKREMGVSKLNKAYVYVYQRLVFEHLKSQS